MQPTTQTGIATFLFTSVDHSALSFQRLDDEEGRALWRAHSEIVRKIARKGQTRSPGLSLAGTGLSPLSRDAKNLGDGFMFVFSSALDALACAASIHQEAARHNQQHGEHNWLQVRVGLHAGEPAREEDIYLSERHSSDEKKK
ncbi:MAG: hypothetical protein HY801_06500 [Candidatus Lindowbacteria bacterium]|nr:hypothetical protein [Candidatus Lindowbacteria bacterium]